MESTFDANCFHFLSNDDNSSGRIGCGYSRRVDSNQWRVGLYGKTADKLVSRKYYLYSVAGQIGIYRGSVVKVQRYGEATAT